MRVLYDISTLGLGHLYQQSRGGGYRADRELTRRLAVSPDCELLLCANHSSVAYHGCVEHLAGAPQLRSRPLIAPRSPLHASAIRRAAALAHGTMRRVLGTNVFPTRLRQGGAFIDRSIHRTISDTSPSADIFHSSAMPLPARVRGTAGPRRFLTVYDAAALVLPELYGPEYRRVFLDAVNSLAEGDHVVTSSEATRAELIERGVAPACRIHVVALAADPEIFCPPANSVAIAAVRRRYGLPDRPYILCVNSPDPRKNTARALRAFTEVVQQERADDLIFVLAGNSGRGTQEQLDIIARSSLHNRVMLIGYVADEDLSALYGAATAFIYPSIYEGFGLPPLEAMQCGTAVITTGDAAVVEVVGDAALVVGPDDHDGMAQAMLSLYRDQELRAARRRRSLARAAEFSWDRSVTQLLTAYRTALMD